MLTHLTLMQVTETPPIPLWSYTGQFKGGKYLEAFFFKDDICACMLSTPPYVKSMINVVRPRKRALMKVKLKINFYCSLIVFPIASESFTIQLKWQKKVNLSPSYGCFNFGFYTQSYLTCKLKLPLPENEICLHKGPFLGPTTNK